jgi:hypothetical protein
MFGWNKVRHPEFIEGTQPTLFLTHQRAQGDKNI